MVPDALIHSMAVQSYNEFLAQNKLSGDTARVQSVKNVGRRIQKAVEKYGADHDIDLEGYQWEFNLVEDASANAWAMPGGKIVVYTGLLPLTRDENGLAVVIGHEVGHVFARHGSERMSQSLVFEMGGIALSEALKTRPAQTQELFMQAYGLGAQVGVLLPFSRKHEYEADHLGLIFMAMAGYDPHAAVGFWERMIAEKQGGSPPELLSTHPADENRIAKIKELIPEALRYYQKTPDKKENNEY